MLVFEYAENGDLHNNLSKNFRKATWGNKIISLLRISEGWVCIYQIYQIHYFFNRYLIKWLQCISNHKWTRLREIHEKNYIHYDLHSGNIFSYNIRYSYSEYKKKYEDKDVVLKRIYNSSNDDKIVDILKEVKFIINIKC